MKPVTAPVIALCLMAIAGAVVWQRMRRDDSPATDLAAETRSGKASHREKAYPAAVMANDPDPVSGEQLKAVSQGFERTRRQLVTDFGLSEAQAGKLSEVFTRREKHLEALLTGEAGDDPDAVRRICDLIRNKGLREDLVGVFSPQQMEAYDAKERKQVREVVEARAYRDMAEVSSVVRLTDGQKQAVLGALMGHAHERAEQEADAMAFASLMSGSSGAGMPPDYIRDVAGMMNMDPAGIPNFDYGSMEHLQRIEQQKAERIGDKIAALKGILDEDQLARYRAHLEAEPPR